MPTFSHWSVTGKERRGGDGVRQSGRFLTQCSPASHRRERVQRAKKASGGEEEGGGGGSATTKKKPRLSTDAEAKLSAATKGLSFGWKVGMHSLCSRCGVGEGGVGFNIKWKGDVICLEHIGSSSIFTSSLHSNEVDR